MPQALDSDLSEEHGRKRGGRSLVTLEIHFFLCLPRTRGVSISRGQIGNH